MKKLLFLFALIAAGLHAQPTTLDLGARGTITFYFIGNWKFADQDMAGQMTLNVTPTDKANAACTITITSPPDDRLNTKARLKQRVEIECASLAERLEGKAVAKEFSLTSGFGFYCDFVDPELKGKPPEKENYKVLTVGKIRLAPDVLVDVQILSDGFKDKPHQELLGAIEGMEFKPGRGR